MRKVAHLGVAAPAAALLLSACGGGGGGGLVSTPPPPPPPTFSYESFPLTKSASFETISGHLDYTGTDYQLLRGPTGEDVGVSGRPSGLTFAYDASAGTYTVADGTDSASFSDSAPVSSGSTDSYTTKSGSVTDQLDLFSNVRSGGSQGAGAIALTYLSFGKWTHSDGQTLDNRITYFLFGSPTDPSDMPHTGTATYSTMVTGSSFAGCYGCDAQPFDGSATVTADFGAGSVNTDLTLTSIGSFQGTGTISGNQFAGNFTGNFTAAGTELQDGAFQGGFFGPSAAEMGYTFSLHEHVLDPYAGAAPVPDTFYVGLVAGSKK